VAQIKSGASGPGADAAAAKQLRAMGVFLRGCEPKGVFGDPQDPLGTPWRTLLDPLWIGKAPQETLLH
jgi:hypothetical protein